ncbi:hypothetical protein [Robertkochia aurantiaca]|uniref:hypothetical protein n=1 Tax=Robertkochia aurantiaca TaxID=2873700 RepID=UPI001CCA2D23|nr:hypothetical protein [Robertkochia sp. 3YJGBD-33]
MQLGYPHPKIKDYFKDLFDNKKQESQDKSHVPIGGKAVLWDVYEVPIDLPRYRLSNTRTIALQEQYVSANSLDEDYFEKDILSDQLQEIQHGLLKNLIQRKGLLDYFKESKNIQTYPLVLTEDGFVISGNRRLCTFRELYYNHEDGNKKYGHFKRVRVVILPKMTEEEIEYVEDYFEQQPDIQDEFTWTNRALGFERRLSKHNYEISDLANKTNVKKSQIQDLLNKLYVAREYLEFIGKPKAYDQIEKDEYAFKEILRSRKKFTNDPAKKDIFQKLSFIALKKQDEISDRMYKNIPLIQQVMDEIQGEIYEELSHSLDSKELSDKEDDMFSLFDEEGDNNDEILELIENQSHEEAVFAIVLDKVNEHKSSEEEKKRKHAVLKKVQKAHKELRDAYNIAGSETKKNGISDQLDNIESVIAKLRHWLNA